MAAVLDQERWCLVREPRTTASAEGEAGAWMSIDAAVFLGVGSVRLRRAIERHARSTGDGQIVAKVDGIVARKLGRTWRV